MQTSPKRFPKRNANVFHLKGASQSIPHHTPLSMMKETSQKHVDSLLTHYGLFCPSDTNSFSPSFPPFF